MAWRTSTTSAQPRARLNHSIAQPDPLRHAVKGSPFDFGPLAACRNRPVSSNALNLTKSQLLLSTFNEFSLSSSCLPRDCCPALRTASRRSVWEGNQSQCHSPGCEFLACCSPEPVSWRCAHVLSCSSSPDPREISATGMVSFCVPHRFVIRVLRCDTTRGNDQRQRPLVWRKGLGEACLLGQRCRCSKLGHRSTHSDACSGYVAALSMKLDWVASDSDPASTTANPGAKHHPPRASRMR